MEVVRFSSVVGHKFDAMVFLDLPADVKKQNKKKTNSSMSREKKNQKNNWGYFYEYNACTGSHQNGIWHT